MINQLKLIKDMYFYSHNAIGGIIMAIFYGVLGLLLSSVGVTGIFFIMICPIWCVECFWTLQASNFVKSSPRKRRLETKSPVLFSFLAVSIMYALYALLVVYASVKGDMETRDMASSMIIAGCAGFLVVLMEGFLYKLPIIATVAYGIMVGMVAFTFNTGYWDSLIAGIPFPAGIIIGFGEIVLGVLLQWGLSCLLYKRPLSKSSMSAKLRKLM